MATPMMKIWSALMPAILLMGTAVTPAAGQFWQATPQELRNHAQSHSYLIQGFWLVVLLTGPPVIGRHEAQWITEMRDHGLIAGECLARNDEDSCDQAGATMVIMR